MGWLVTSYPSYPSYGICGKRDYKNFNNSTWGIAVDKNKNGKSWGVRKFKPSAGVVDDHINEKTSVNKNIEKKG